MMTVFKNLYVAPGNQISIERAVELDARRDASKLFSPDVYRQPVLTEKMSEPQIPRPSLGGSINSSSSPVLELGASGKIV
jgi:hypothetical protein